MARPEACVEQPRRDHDKAAQRSPNNVLHKVVPMCRSGAPPGSRAGLLRAHRARGECGQFADRELQCWACPCRVTTVRRLASGSRQVSRCRSWRSSLDPVHLRLVLGGERLRLVCPWVHPAQREMQQDQSADDPISPLPPFPNCAGAGSVAVSGRPVVHPVPRRRAAGGGPGRTMPSGRGRRHRAQRGLRGRGRHSR